MESALDAALRDLWQHLTSDRQSWLLGAGVSFMAGIPLMVPLTTHVVDRVAADSPEQAELLTAIRDQLPQDCHVEHMLSQIGDFIALADRSRAGSVQMTGKDVAADALRDLHTRILEAIGNAVRYGYRPPRNGQPEVRGTASQPIISVDDHRSFVRHLFAAREKPGFQQVPITFFTTNYDTLIEDALALQQVPFADGFLGGAMGFWAPDVGFTETRSNRAAARVVKLHGSVDWHRSEDGSVIRCRNGCAYPSRDGNLLIYPQSTKYVATQKDPFAALFSLFRQTLSVGPDNVLGICGYSFGDDHIDGEIEAVMSHQSSKTVIVAFAQEVLDPLGEPQLPTRVREWLTARPWRDRVFVASSKGLYHGSMTNLCDTAKDMDWWTFQGLTNFLSEGPEYLPAAAPGPIPSPEVTLTEAAE
ncbi:SIR2 family protein [Microvirga sp. M2]|uniref:SIR2 family protein n=1 Tax=Microvirga sp. M2 TaxID=3073270 RepID=UPI0039C45CE6